MQKDIELAAANDYANYSLQCLIGSIRKEHPLLTQTEATRAAAKVLTALGCNTLTKHWRDLVEKAVQNVRKETN